MGMLAVERTAVLRASQIAARVGSRRVLLVEDDPSVRLIGLLELWLAGFEVTEAGDGQRGVEQARLPPPDLVVSDIRMSAGVIERTAAA